MFRHARVGAVVVVTALALSACGSSGDDAGPTTDTSSVPTSSFTTGSAATPSTTAARATAPRTYAPDAFVGVDAALEQRVANAGLPGGYVRIVADDDAVIHEHGVGSVTSATPLDIASSSKWLTAATFMTFVDDHAVGLDDDIARWLPEFAGSTPPITPRMLMDHTSGVHDNSCQNGGVSLTACVQTLAVSSREFTPGSAFSYGNSPLLVVGRLVEVLGGADFASVVQQRLAGPLGMSSTTWPGAPEAPNPAFGATTTVDDYGRFVAMLLHGGTAAGRRILSRAAVDEMVRNQVAAYDTTHDYSVGITGIPRYGLGCWPDVVGSDGATEVVSGNGGKGLYPWIDFTSRTWGVVGVQDDRGADVAVPASQQVEVAARTAVDG
ncbi:MAG TPA: serine hydrolase domain-containing protein [Acidimicrobiia bacterium]|jgi:CubicO group peptidase (beta-lactamase class C family)